MANKKKSVRKGREEHALQRAVERYGAYYTKKDLQAIARKIQKGRGLFMSKTSNTRSTWLIECYGQLMRVAYNKNTKQIVSFLPLPLLPKKVWDSMLERLHKKVVEPYDRST